MTRLLAYLREAVEALWRNRARSLLTVLGTIVGTASTIGILGIGRAAAGGIDATLGAFGNPGYFVSVDPKGDDPNASRLQYRDAAELLAAEPAALRRVYPIYSQNASIESGGTRIIGNVSSQVGEPGDNLPVREGRRIDDADVAGAAHVAVLGAPMADRLFPHRSALGNVVRIGGNRYTVVGVYDALHASIFTAAGGSDYLEIPYSAYHELAPGGIDQLQVFGQPGTSLAQVKTAVDQGLRRLHGRDASYVVQDALAFETAFERTIGVVGIGLTAIGGVALVVAGIGIMNVMLVSVSERRREIGLRKAIGGSRADIALQFLMESVVLSFTGGILGTLLGVLFVVLASGIVAGFLGPAPIPWLLIVASAAGFSIVVGVGFGTYPALRAAALDPIEALRG